jgi:hypothetical protein
MLHLIAPNLWCIRHDFRVGFANIGTRTTIVRLSDGSLLVHSPGPPGPYDFKSVRELGPVRALVAPNAMHHLFVPRWSSAFPEARIYGAPGLRERVRTLRVDEVLGDEPPSAWGGDVRTHLIQGAASVNEIVLMHEATNTLIVADLVFNIRRADDGWTRMAMRLNDSFGKFGPSRICRLHVKDKQAQRRSIEALLAWDFDRVTVTHGDVLETGGKQAIIRAFE